MEVRRRRRRGAISKAGGPKCGGKAASLALHFHFTARTASPQAAIQRCVQTLFAVWASRIVSLRNAGRVHNSTTAIAFTWADGGKPLRDSLAACSVHQLSPPTCLTVGRLLSAAPSSSKLAAQWGLSTIYGALPWRVRGRTSSREIKDALYATGVESHNRLEPLPPGGKFYVYPVLYMFPGCSRSGT